MFDGRIRPFIDRPLDTAGHWLARRGLRADQITLAGFALGLAGAGAISVGSITLGLVLFVAGRLADGLDGAVARATQPSDRGAFLDIVLDFALYAAIPLAFAVHDPAANALPATVLLAAFLANGSAFLAFALMAERRKLTTSAQGRKSIYYLAGLAEGAETIAVFVLFCLFPASFPWLAVTFAALCLVSAAARVVLAWRALV